MKSALLLIVLSVAFFSLIKLPVFNETAADPMPGPRICNKERQHHPSYRESWPYLYVLG